MTVLFFFIACASQRAGGHPYHVDHTDEELLHMDTESLLHVEGDLRQQNKVVDKHIASLHGRIELAGEKQRVLEKAFKKLESGRDWESRQKLNKEKELSLAKAEMQTKRDQMATISAHADEIRKQIRALENKMVSIKGAGEDIEARYANPTILDVVDGQLDHLGPTSHTVLNKTLHTLLFPGFSSGAASVDRLRQHMRGSTQHVAIASTLTIYSFLVFLVWLIVRGYRRLTGRLTLSRMLFTADLAFCAFWTFVGVWSLALMEDPIAIMRRHNEAMLIASQWIIAFAIVWYIFIRCVSFAATMHGKEGFELFSSLFIIQHYYQSVWVPSFSEADTYVGGQVFFLYAGGHLVLAARRARSQVLSKQTPHNSIGGTALPEEFSGSSEQGFSWFLSQMRLVALAVEALLFAASPRPDPLDERALNQSHDEPMARARGLGLYMTDYDESDESCSEYSRPN